MDEKIIKQYLKYANSKEAYAVLFVKKFLHASNGKWINIIEVKNPKFYYADKLEFKLVLCELFERKMKPKYPEQSKFEDEESYKTACRAVTWKVSHEDMNKQIRRGIKGSKYLLKGIKCHTNKSYFLDDAPKKIKDLEKNINDRTDPLWEKAMEYVSDGRKFKIISIKRIK